MDAPAAPRSDRRRHDRDILRLAVPALGALAAEPLYLLADTAVVGHLGTDALAGLAVASTILLLGHSLFIFLAYGTTAAVARLLGAGDEREAARQAVQSVWLAAAIGVGVTVVGLVFSSQLVGVLGGEGTVAANAELYLRISLLGVPALLISLAATGYLRGLQDVRTPLVVAVAGAVANLVLEVIAIYGLGFGIGASAATTVVVQLAVAAVYLRRIGRTVRAHDVPLAPHAPTIRRLGRVGSDLMVRTLALRGSLTVATAVAARSGPTALAAHQITFEVWSFLALVLDALAIAAQAMIGRHLGAGDPVEARAVGRRLLEWGIGAGVIVGVLLAAVRVPLAGVFVADAAVADITATLLLVAAVLQPVNALVFVLDGLLIGAGDLAYLAVAMVLGLIAFLPAALAVLVTDAGVTALWGALGLLMLTRLATLWLRWRGERWARTGPTR